MMCKDCSMGYKLNCLHCGKEIIVCTVDSEPEIINNKYWEDNDACDGVDEQ